MTRHFMRDTPLYQMEQMMMTPPYFKPRGHSLRRSGFRYQAKDVDCEYCMNYSRRNLCPLYQQSLQFFRTDEHRRRWMHWRTRYHRLSQRNQAALFLLTAYDDIWRRVIWKVEDNGFDFDSVRLAGIQPELYSVYQAAKAISIGSQNITIADLASRELVTDEAFQLIICALLLAKYGILTEMLNSLQAIRNRRMLWSLDVIELNKQISELTSQNQMLATLKQQGLIDPDIFISQNNELTEQLRTAKLKKERLLVADGDSTIAQTRELMEILDAGPDFLDDFDAELFGELVEKIIVDSSEQLRFRLKNGLELVEIIERTVR